MLPVIFSVGPITLYSFALVSFIAFFAFTFVVWKRGRELYFDEEDLFDSIFFILLWFLVGSRIGYVIQHFEDFGFAIWSWLNIFGRPGFMYLSGLVAGVMAAWYKARANKWDVFSFGDVLAVALSLGMALMAAGLFLNGSGYGIATESFLGVTFPGLLEKRLPVQLLEMVLYGGLFGLLWWLEGKYRTFSWYKGKKSEANSGFILAVFLIGHGLVGFITTLLRPASLVIIGIRWDWMIYIVLLVMGGWVMMSRGDIRIMQHVKSSKKRRGKYERGLFKK